MILHYKINEFLENKEEVIYGSLGNGWGTDFLLKNFRKVYVFESKSVCEEYAKKL